ncbi:lipopolysaccharide kinase InaA family protein [Actinoplanes sp. RD1]|uniref:lipopolysaccharide kinase InaA family protein n=1 Tax=Actinoplanes sp. RD1 TaxID=3064538 RepID=UPI002740FE7E|nr:lipopolysaccharide kinase InaA family protein [Actinoplanes sp. RD1]
MDEQRQAIPWPHLPARTLESSLQVDGRGRRGGSAVVFQLVGQLDLLYKRYTGTGTVSRSETHLAQLVAIGSAAGDPELSFLRRHFAWPRSVVIGRDGNVTGLLVPRVPPAFEAALVTNRVRVRDLNDLLFETRAARAGISPATRRQKLEMLSDLIEALDWLHRHDLVHEDLAAQNVLWRTEGGAGVLLLDCDSLRPLGRTADDPLLTSVDWTDPRVLAGDVRRPDHASMIYGLGLLTARVLADPDWRPPDNGREGFPADRMSEALAAVVVDSVRPGLPRPSLVQWRKAVTVATATLRPDTATDVDRPEVTTAAPPPIEYEGPGSDAARRISLAVGVVLGAALAAILVLGLL